MSYETISYKNHVIELNYDSYGESPREFENIGTIAYKHGNYILGEEEITDPIDWLEDMCEVMPKYEYTNERLEILEGIFYDKFIALPLYLFDHSGISISTTPFSCRWDSGKVGYIYAEISDVKKMFHWKNLTNKRRLLIQSYFEGEIETFDKYLRGEIFHYNIDGDLCNDSCGGYYDEKEAISDAKYNIDCSVNKAKKEHFERVKTYIRNRVPFQYRTQLINL